jgi:hypothetical protein
MSITNFSLLLPTRGRPHLISKLFTSIVETTAHLEELEVVLYIDEDDLSSHKISHPSLRIKKLIRPRTTMGCINRACYEASEGRFVMLLNDDVLFRTSNWDLAVINAFAQFPDSIVLVYGNDLFRGRQMASFPILSRTTCELMGSICPSEYRGDLIDVHIFDIFKRLARFGYDRILYLEDVIFEHLHFLVNKSQFDATYMGRVSEVDIPIYGGMFVERHRAALRLAEYIKNFSSNEKIHSFPMKKVIFMQETILLLPYLRKEIRRVFDECLSGKRAVLYGVSSLAEMVMIEAFGREDVSVVGFADGMPEKHYQKFLGRYTILPISEIPLDEYDAVLICARSGMVEEEIFNDIQYLKWKYGKEIIRLYSELSKS